MNCVQCSKDHNGTEKVCNGCVADAMTIMEGCLGGRPTPEQVYRLFDMGGCGVSPLEQFKPVVRKRPVEVTGPRRVIIGLCP